MQIIIDFTIAMILFGFMCGGITFVMTLLLSWGVFHNLTRPEITMGIVFTIAIILCVFIAIIRLMIVREVIVLTNIL